MLSAAASGEALNMPSFRLYFLDGAGRVNSAEWIDAADDAAAIERATERFATSHGELWQGNRRIATFPPEEATSSDRA
jgi:hypothetical protein